MKKPQKDNINFKYLSSFFIVAFFSLTILFLMRTFHGNKPLSLRAAASSNPQTPIQVNGQFDSASTDPLNFNQAILTNPDGNYAMMKVIWARVNPSPGVYDFSMYRYELDKLMTSANHPIFWSIVTEDIADNGQSTGCTSDTSWGVQEIPDYEVQKLASQSALFCDTDDGSAVPAYWSGTWQQDWKTNFVDQVASWIATLPQNYQDRLLYDRCAIGFGGESFPLRHGPQNTRWNYFNTTFGFTWDKYITNWQHYALPTCQNDFSQFGKGTHHGATQTVFGINSFWGAKNSGVDPVTGVSGESWQQTASFWALEKGFGFGTQSLSGGVCDFAQTCSSIQYAYAHAGQQATDGTSWPTDYFIQWQTQSGLTTSDLPATIQLAYCYRTSAIEWYANVLNNSANWPSLDTLYNYTNGIQTPPPGYCTNGIPTPTPFFTPTPIPTNTPTFTPTPIPTNTPTSTPMPTNTPTPTPIPPDTTPPIVAITNPTNNSIVTKGTKIVIKVSATDDVNVTQVQILVNGTLLCTDILSPYNCGWNVPNKSSITYTITARAFDPTGNTASKSITVKSSR